MKTYDDEQQLAIDAHGGHYLVLAPPGCGKTDILSERIAVAKEQQGVSYTDMLCLTFTNRASRGMRSRVQERVGDDARSIFVGNVHRYCSNFLYSNSLIPENTAIIDDSDIDDILTSFNPRWFNLTSPNKLTVSEVDDIDAYLTQRRLGHPVSAIFLPEERYEGYYQQAAKCDFDPQKAESTVLQLTLLYQQYKRERNLISFSDILILAYEHLRRDTERQFRRYKWIQVDEVQDLNSLQMAIIDELLDTTAPDFTAMYLGDEQQAIFSFLGAKLGQLQLLRQRCEGHVMTLGKNYRSPKYLLDIFNTYAEEQLGVDPAILPQSVYDAKHEKFDLILTSNRSVYDEDERVSKMIEYYLNFDDERVAILVPTNRTADRISHKLLGKGIPHFKISGTDMFKSTAYKTLAAFFSVSVNDFNLMAWSRLLSGIGAIGNGSQARRFVSKLKSLMMTPSDTFGDKSYVARFCDDYMNREFVFFDTETTGLNVLDDDIVQIAAFKVNCGEKVEGSDFVIFLHTDRQFPLRLGDIDNPLIEAYDNNPHYSRTEGLRLFLDYIGDCPVLGHNVGYDYHILQNNVMRTLNEQITLECYDSLRLIKCVEPNLRMYKLAFLLKQLQLEGKNSHLADEDIAATKALVDYCYQKALPIIAQQQSFVAHPKVQNIIKKAEVLLPLLGNLHDHIYQPVQATGRTIADEIKDLYDTMRSQNVLKSQLDDNKFSVFLQYVQSEWVNYEKEETLYDQISAHITDMTASINEGDLVNSRDLISDRVFIMTVYKAKGLEFENVAVLEANNGVYPYYTVNKVLHSDEPHTADEIRQAQMDLMEDARKFYVALSRAKKRLCISYTDRYARSSYDPMTPFMQCIAHYFCYFAAPTRYE